MNDLFKYGLLAVGGWMLYEYFYGASTVAATTPVSSTTVPPVGSASGQPGYTNNPTPAPSSNVVSPTSQASVTQISTNIRTQLQQLANGYLVANPNAGELNVDQWNYYLAQITGVQLSGEQGEQLILALGESDATRGTIIPLSVYLTALSATGLGKLGMGMIKGLGLIRSMA